jgi:hypothetical protein
MQLSRIASGVVLVLVASAVGGILANFLTRNDLLTSSEWQTAAVLSFGVVLLGLVLFAVAGRPWRRWDRTPYW